MKELLLGKKDTKLFSKKSEKLGSKAILKAKKYDYLNQMMEEVIKSYDSKRTCKIKLPPTYKKHCKRTRSAKEGSGGTTQISVKESTFLIINNKRLKVLTITVTSSTDNYSNVLINKMFCIGHYRTII